VEPTATDLEQHARRLSLAIGCGVTILVLLAVFQLVPSDLPPGLSLALEAGATSTLLTLVSVGLAALGRTPVAERLGLVRGRAGIVVVLVLAVGLLGLSHALDQLINLFNLRASSHLAQYDAAVAGEPQTSWPWMLLGLALAPGIGEEIFFRGLLQREARRWIGPSAAIVLVSALFGVFHGDMVHAAGAFALGLYLGGVAEMTGSTWAAVACHVLNNLAAVAGVALPAQETLHPMALAGIGLALAALCLLGTGGWLRLSRLPAQGNPRALP
jgi:membrane protease YdiL (CAAX protease family)